MKCQVCNKKCNKTTEHNNRYICDDCLEEAYEHEDAYYWYHSGGDSE